MSITYAQLVTAVQDYTQNTFDTTTINTLIQQAEQRVYNTVQIANLRKNVTGVLSSGNKYLACPGDFLSTYSIAIYPVISTSTTGTSGAFTVTVSSATNIAAGQTVAGTGIGTGAIVRSVSGTTVLLTVANSGTVSGTVTFTGDYLYLLNKDVNWIREAYPNTAGRGEPQYYALFGPQSSNVNELSFILGPTPNEDYYAELHYYYYPESIVTASTTWLGDNFDSVLLYGTLCEAGVYMKSDPTDGMYTMYQDRYVQAIALLKNLGDGKQRADAYRDGQVRVQVS
jgi:hypothetical protein